MSPPERFDGRPWRDGVSGALERLRDWLAGAGLLDADAARRLDRLRACLAEERPAADFADEAARMSEEARGLTGEARRLLTMRLEALDRQQAELAGLRGKSRDMVRHMMRKAKDEKGAFDRSLRDFYAARSVSSRLADALFGHLGMETLRGHARRARDAMRGAAFTIQLRSAMGELFRAARDGLAQSERDVAEIAAMMASARERFAEANGLRATPPAAFSLAGRVGEIDLLEEDFRRRFDTFFNLLTRGRRTLTRRFFETVVARIRKTYEAANRDAEEWLQALMAPLEAQVREVRRQIRRHLENIRRIHEAADALEDRIEDAKSAQAALNARLAELDGLEAALGAALRAPGSSP